MVEKVNLDLMKMMILNMKMMMIVKEDLVVMKEMIVKEMIKEKVKEEKVKVKVKEKLKDKCKVVKEYGDLPPTYCLISQLNQVFMNLLVNASHAIEQQGTITIRTRQTESHQLCIEINDTGCGIPKENLTRIFNPFFTTKPVGKGTGLGLSLSYSIVERHHGKIEVESELGVGTTFRILLPHVAAPPAQPDPEETQ